MKTIIYGDSLAGNFGITPDKAWAELIGGQKIKLTVQVIFKNGFTTTDLLECLNREVLAKNPDRVLFVCGTNDALRQKDYENIAAGIQCMAREIAKAKAEPIWLIPPQLEEDEVLRVYGDPPKLVRAANETLSKLRAMMKADPPVFKTVDLEAIRQDYLKDHGNAYWDGIHFTAQFHRYLAMRLTELI